MIQYYLNLQAKLAYCCFIHLASRRVEGGLSRAFPGLGRKPWVPSTCAGDLRGLLMVALRGQGNWRWEGPLGDSTGLGALEEGLISS